MKYNVCRDIPDVIYKVKYYLCSGGYRMSKLLRALRAGIGIRKCISSLKMQYYDSGKMLNILFSANLYYSYIFFQPSDQFFFQEFQFFFQNSHLYKFPDKFVYILYVFCTM